MQKRRINMDITQLMQHPLLSLVPSIIRNAVIFYMLCKVLDFLTGGLKIWKDPEKFKSRIMREGIIRWIGEIAAVVFVIAIDMFMGLNFYLTGFILATFIIKEGGSIDENLKDIGVDLPRIVFEKLGMLAKGNGGK